MINRGMMSSKKDLWSTPDSFFTEVSERFDFDTDVCAVAENAKCHHYYTPEENGLLQDWKGICWMNPPYGREIGKWVQKAYEEANKHNSIIVALLPARTDTKWFHEWIYMMYGVEIEFIKGRLKFGDAKHSAPFPSMLVVFKKRIGG